MVVGVVELALPPEDASPGWVRETSLYRFLTQVARGALRLRDRP